MGKKVPQNHLKICPRLRGLWRKTFFDNKETNKMILNAFCRRWRAQHL